MLKAFYLALLLVAPVVFSQSQSRYTVPQNWVDNRPSTCGNILRLIDTVDDNRDIVNSRIRGIRNALAQLPRQLTTLNRYCRNSRGSAAARRNVQTLIRQVDNLAQPLIDDPVQRAQFGLDQFNNGWSSNRFDFVCYNVYYNLQALIGYFQWLSPALQSYYLNPRGVIPNRLAALNSYKNTCLCPGNDGLCIVGATWGTAEVTNLVQRRVNGQNLRLRAAENPLPRNSKPNGYDRSLVVVYQQGNSKPQVAIAKEGDTLTINRNNRGQRWNGPTPRALNILGAAWGLSDVTSELTHAVSRNRLTVNPSTNQFSDSWPNVQKTLMITYQNATGIHTANYVEVYDNTSYTIRY